MPILVTACSKKKKGNPQVLAAALAQGSIESVVTDWVRALSVAAKRTPAGQLYQGGSHAESRRAVEVTGYPHFIVSAGLGLVSAEVEVPHYAASVLAGGDNVVAKLGPGAGAAEWWRWLQRRSPFATSLEAAMRMSDGVCLIALPRPYLEMVRDELLGLAPRALERVRLFSGTRLRTPFADLQMPYDDRLDGPDSPHRGTRSNFASRALHHFVRHVLPGNEQESALAHAEAVEAALASWRSAKRSTGLRKSDAELRQLLNQHWDAVGGRSTHMLRLLRDDLGIACEQRRFAGLVRAVREERGIGA